MSSKQQSFLDEPSPAAAKPGRKSQLDRLNYKFDEVVSALQKEIRGGDEEAALYWGLLLYDAAPAYAWKRVLICAAEDIGFADAATVQLVQSLALGWRICAERSHYVDPNLITMAIMALARAPKSTECDDAKNWVLELHKQGVRREVPGYAQDQHTAAGRAQGKGEQEWYADRHGRCAIPLNRFTRLLAALRPGWFGGVAGLVADER